jgi:hypothetical protein
MSSGSLVSTIDSGHHRPLSMEANYKASYLGAISHFLDCLCSGENFETAPEDNIQTLEIVERAYVFSSFSR